MPEFNFMITNLNCEACVKLSTMALRKLPGVTDVSIELSTGATHIASTETISSDDVLEALKAKGYSVSF